MYSKVPLKPDVFSDVYDGADGDDQRCNCGCDDLLHDERHNPDNLVDEIYRANHGKHDTDGTGNRGGDWFLDECSWQC
jgi:hypothetical protein